MENYGSNRYLNDNELDVLATKMNIKIGSTITKDDIRNAI